MQEKAIRQALRKAFDVSRGRAKYSTIRDRINDAARIDGIHLCQLIAAMIIASIGLNTDSTEAVIGAMLICPLMGSVLALSCAVATMDMRLFRQAVGGLLLQGFICLCTSTLYFYLSPLAIRTSELLTNSSATIWDVMIALVGGFAGALGLSRRQEPSTLISGVAVATALMPPLCSVGYGIASNEGMLALSALYEFLVNVFFIAFGSTLVLLWLRMPLIGDLDGDGKESPEEVEEAERESHVLRHRLVIALLVFAVPCVYYSVQLIQSSIAETGTVFEVVDSYNTELVTSELEVICPGFESHTIGVEDEYGEKNDAVEQKVVATVETSEELSPMRKREIDALIHLHVTDLDLVDFVTTSGD